MVVAYRSVTIHYKIHAPSSDAIIAWEFDFLRGGGHSLTHSINLKKRQLEHEVRIEFPQGRVRFQGEHPFDEVPQS